MCWPGISESRVDRLSKTYDIAVMRSNYLERR